MVDVPSNLWMFVLMLELVGPCAAQRSGSAAPLPVLAAQGAPMASTKPPSQGQGAVSTGGEAWER